MKKLHKISKKVLCITLICAMLVTSMGAYSGEVQENEQTIEEFAQQMMDENPYLEVRVVDDTLHIVDNTPQTEISLYSSSDSSFIYAPTGGTYRNFRAKNWWYTGTTPYTMVFLHEDMAKIIHLAKNNVTTFESMVEDVANTSLEYAQSLMAEDYDQNADAITVYFVIGITAGVIDAIIELDRASYNNAYDQFEKVAITRTMMNGYPSVIYSAWGSNSVSISPYDEYFTAEFYPEEFNI